MGEKKTIIIAVVLWIFTIGTVGIFVLMEFSDKQTKENTTELVATVEKVEITNTEDNVCVEIITEEYEVPLYISTNISKNIDVATIDVLLKNQSIVFRVKNRELAYVDKNSFINIVALKTLDKEVFSLSDYNKWIDKSLLPTKIACVVLGTVLLAMSIYWTLRIKTIISLKSND